MTQTNINTQINELSKKVALLQAWSEANTEKLSAMQKYNTSDSIERLSEAVAILQHTFKP